MAEKLSTVATIGAANESASLPVSGMGGVAIQVQGTFSGTITFEASVQGQDFAPFRVTPSDGTTAVTTATTTGLWVGSTVGYLVVRARMSSYTSGKAIVFLQAELASPGGSGGGGGTGSDVNLIEVGGAAIALGQTTMAASLPVVLASNQTAIPVTGSFSSASVGATGAAVPASADFVGFSAPTGNLTGLAASNLDYATDGSTVPQTVFGLALPGTTGPVAAVGGAGAVSTQVQRVTLASDDPAVAVLGAITGAAVITDATGTIQQYLRGIIKLAITAGGWLVTATLSAGTAIIGSVRSIGYQNAMWSTSHFPAANTQATITKASAGGGVKNVCTGYSVTLAAQTAAPAAIQLVWELLDGSAVLDGGVLSLPAVAGATTAIIKGHTWIEGSDATAMTLRLSAAGGANTIQAVALYGTTK